MENQDRQSRAMLTASIVLIALIGAAVIGAVYLRVSSTAPKTSASVAQSSETVSVSSRTSAGSTNAASTTTSANGTLSPYWSPQPYLNASAAYASLGYPMAFYDYYTTPYLRSEPNYTMFYQSQSIGNFDIGTVEADAISLDEAVDIAAAHAGLGPTNYTLGQATFVYGDIFNGALTDHPYWYLDFAEIHDGYWIYGNEGPQLLSVEVTVDALDGTIQHMEGDKLNLPNTGQFDMKVNASEALQIVRDSNITGVPPEVTRNGTVAFLEPRVVVPNEYPETSWLDSALPGHSELLWIVGLEYPSTQSVEEGATFAVDASSGQLIGGPSGAGGFGNPQPGGAVSGSLVLSSARNLSVSQQAFHVNGSLIGKAGSIPVIVPHVLVAEPGSTGSIELNFTVSDGSISPNLTLSLVNPLPGSQNLSSDGFPPGVSLEFSRTTLSPVTNGSTYVTLSVSVGAKAPPGTYLIDAATVYRGSVRTQVLFFLTIWNGVGSWPPPRP